MLKKPIQRTPEESAQIKRIVQVWYLNDREYPVGTRTGLKKLARQLRVDGKYLHMLIRRFKGDLDHAPQVLEPISEPESYAETVKRVLAEHPLPGNLAPASPGLGIEAQGWQPTVKPLHEVNDALSPHIYAMTYREWESQAAKPDRTKGYAPVYSWSRMV